MIFFVRLYLASISEVLHLGGDAFGAISRLGR